MGTNGSQDLVQRSRIDHLLIISMQRESKRNSINRAMADGIDAALNEFDDDPDLWVAVLTGTDTVFSAGSDLNANGDYHTERGGEYGIIRRRRTKPLIAAVEGAALGGGLEIVLACDLVVASRTARFGLPEVRIGVVATCAGLFRGPRALPLNVARQLALTGQPMDAERAYSLGLVNELTAPGDALPEAIRMAQTIVANSPTSVRATLRAIEHTVAADDDEGWAATAEAKATIAASEDSVEGVRSFLEKRPPRWTGR